MTYRSDLLQWLDELPPGWFWARDVPGPGSTSRPVLSRLANDASSQITRVAHGFYYKAHEGSNARWDASMQAPVSALLYAGPGSGLCAYDALGRMGWTTQISAKIDVAALRSVRPFERYVRYRKHPNGLRAALSWSEVTMLEALQFFTWFSDVSWPRALKIVASGESARRQPWSHLQPFVLRREPMLAAVKQEPTIWWGNPRLQIDLIDLAYRVNEICEVAVDCEMLAAA